MHCLILAGGTIKPGDPLYELTQGRPKALLPIGDKTMLEWVAAAVQGSRQVEEVVVVGIDAAAAADLQFARPVHFLPDNGSMIANMRAGTTYIAAQWPDAQAVLGVSADIPAITSEIVDGFVESCRPWDAAVYYNFVSRQTMEARFPGSNRTYTHLAGMDVAGGDMSMARIGILEENTALVEAASKARKQPWRVARLVGLPFLVRFLLKRVTLADIEHTATRLVGRPVKVLLSPNAELAMDADKPSQVELLRRELLG